MALLIANTPVGLSWVYEKAAAVDATAASRCRYCVVADTFASAGPMCATGFARVPSMLVQSEIVSAGKDCLTPAHFT
jgi:hypothetical protein